MARPDHLSYGVVNPEKYVKLKARMSDSETIKLQGCNFLVLDANGYYDVADASSTLLHGIIVDSYDGTTSSTAGDTVLSYVPATSYPVFEIDVITGTITQAMEGETCDLAVSSGKVGLDVTASTTDVMLILEVDVTNNKAKCTFNPEKLTGYADVA